MISVKEINQIIADPKSVNDLTAEKKIQLIKDLGTYKGSEKSLRSRDVAVAIVEKSINDNSKPTFDTASVAEDIAKNTCVLEIHVRQPGFKKKIRSTEFLDRSGNEAHVDPDALHVSQEIIDRRELKDIKKLKRSLVNWLSTKTVPGGLLTLGNGQYLVPVTNIEAIHDKVQEFIVDRQELLDQFEGRYEDIKSSAKQRRGDFYDPADYPPFELLRSRYNTDYKFSSNTVPSEIQKASKALYEVEKARILKECAEAAQEIRDAQRTAMIGYTEHLVERLGLNKAGKPNTFHESSITKFVDFLDNFKSLNLTKDEELESLVEQAKDLISGADVKYIRKDEGFREALKEDFEQLKTLTDKLVVKKARKFNFKEED